MLLIFLVKIHRLFLWKIKGKTITMAFQEIVKESLHTINETSSTTGEPSCSKVTDAE